jgi:lipopolysaccharide assembly outer membrane protein LptD (OstA)
VLRFAKLPLIIIPLFLFILLSAEPTCAQYILFIKQNPQEEKADKKEKKRARKAQQEKGEKTEPDDEPADEAKPSAPKTPTGEEVAIYADKQTKDGDNFIYEGYVNATVGIYRLQADRIIFNDATKDAVAEGNVIFDEGEDQRITAKRAEINLASKRGTFWDTTGFSNRTQTGEYIYFTAEQVNKTGPETYELINADVTACEDAIPKWIFHSKRAELKKGDRLILNKAVFRVKDVPVFYLPYAWIPSTRTGRKSGFLLPTTGSSNQKGRTFRSAYYQTLGQSADITFRNDIYTSRGLGFGAEFRAQTDERSYMRLGTFTVKDRLFGPPGDNQGGTAFSGEGIQYLPHGWLAVGNVSLVSSLQFRQAFSDDITQVIDPRRESTFYANNNTGNFSFNFLASNETTRLFRPNKESFGGTDFDVRVRQAPEINLTMYPHRIFENLPIYFSFDSDIGALKRENSVNDNIVLITPAAVQRFDFQPKVTIPLATFAGIALTPTFSFRETYYTSSLDPLRTGFNPELFAASPDDPRLNPLLAEYNPNITVYNREQFDPIIPNSLLRSYGEFALDIRPPSLEKIFLNPDGSRRFKHLIEPYITYRLIQGVGNEFNQIIRFDERDAVANTNEFEYALVNRFYTMARPFDSRRERKLKRQQTDAPSQMEIERPENRRKKDKTKSLPDDIPPSDKSSTEGASTENQSEKKEKKLKLESGERAELTNNSNQPDRRNRSSNESAKTKAASDDSRENAVRSDDNSDASTANNLSSLSEAERLAESATNEDAPEQVYEFLTIKVAQKYFFDRTFGGALQPFSRNQFFPINTLSGFTYGGRARSFSPANIQVRYRPLSSIFADVRMDVGTEDGAIRNLTFAGGFEKDKVSVSTGWYVSRRINLDANSFEPGSFPGNQLMAIIQYGDEGKGFYGGTRIGYDFTDQLISETFTSTGRLRNSRSYFGYAFDCCGIQFNYNTFKAGLRNEGAFTFTFTLAGLGSFGSDQFSELGNSGGNNARRRAKRARKAAANDY